jgi:hypothetical protein
MIRAVVLAGAPPAFCAGSDLKELGGTSIPDMCAQEAETAMVARKIGFLGKPAELAPGVNLDRDVLAQMAFAPILDRAALCEMDCELFAQGNEVRAAS